MTITDTPTTTLLLVLVLTIPIAEVSAASEENRGPAMVAIPAGAVHIGCNEKIDSECEGDEKPGGLVEIGAFEIDLTEVTVAHYEECVDAGGCSAEGLSMPTTGTVDQLELVWTCNWGVTDRAQHPINCLSFEMAAAYCKWAGKRLPTATEWERAARGTDGRRYPWGNDDVTPSPQANLSDVTLLRNEPGGWGLEQYNDTFISTAPVGSFPAGDSPVGAKDMAGNVWELTSDGNEQRKEMRGGSWSYFPHSLRVSDKAYASNGRRNGDTGFRCAR